jgi:hypothetical protein
MLPREDKIEDEKNSCCDKLERVFNEFPKFYIKMLLGDLNSKLGNYE